MTHGIAAWISKPKPKIEPTKSGGAICFGCGAECEKFGIIIHATNCPYTLTDEDILEEIDFFLEERNKNE